jgi:hypothetical protein
MAKIAQLETGYLKETPQLKSAGPSIDHKYDTAQKMVMVGDSLPLPCHYFDYIFGTGTGGYCINFYEQVWKLTFYGGHFSLSAIMLGRLRMDVNECLKFYGELGSEVFGHPRRLHVSRNLFVGRWWWPRSKYNCKKFEQLLQTTIRHFAELGSEDSYFQHDFFPLEDNKCRT